MLHSDAYNLQECIVDVLCCVFLFLLDKDAAKEINKNFDYFFSFGEFWKKAYRVLDRF